MLLSQIITACSTLNTFLLPRSTVQTLLGSILLYFPAIEQYRILPQRDLEWLTLQNIYIYIYIYIYYTQIGSKITTTLLEASVTLKHLANCPPLIVARNTPCPTIHKASPTWSTGLPLGPSRIALTVPLSYMYLYSSLDPPCSCALGISMLTAS